MKLRKIILISFLVTSCFTKAYCQCDSQNPPATQSECELAGGIWSGDPDFGGCTCPPPTETPLDESAGMFAGAIVAMGAYVLYRKRKLSKQK